jgi:hypothetical protein
MSNYDFEPKFYEFSLAVNLVVDAFQLMNKDLVESCFINLIQQVGFEETMHIMNAAIFQLANTKSKACYWTWKNFPDLEASLDLKEYVVMFAVKILMRKNFVLGKDFSIANDGKILLTEKAKSTLVIEVSSFERVFLEEVLLTTKS